VRSNIARRVSEKGPIGSAPAADAPAPAADTPPPADLALAADPARQS
jgi:hypothetical protein